MEPLKPSESRSMIRIADYSVTPGGRYPKHGPFSADAGEKTTQDKEMKAPSPWAVRFFRESRGTVYRVEHDGKLSAWLAHTSTWAVCGESWRLDFPLAPCEDPSLPKIEAKQGPELWAWMCTTHRAAAVVGDEGVSYCVGEYGTILRITAASRELSHRLPGLPCVPADGEAW